MYPTKIEVNGRIYKINTDYKVALACFRAIEDNEISETERALAVITLLLGKDVKEEDYVKCLEKCAIYLRCGKEENDDIGEADMDYIIDEVYIRTSIRQCYHIDLNKEKNIHWWEYNELIEGLTEETILNQRRELRNFDETKVEDIKERNKIRKAKNKISLKKKNKPKANKEQIENVLKFYKELGYDIRKE